MTGYDFQQADTLAGTWQHYIRDLYFYTASGQDSVYVEFYWDNVAQAWSNTSRYTNTYNAAGDHLTTLGEIGGAAGAWENSFRTLYSYNSSGKVSTYRHEEWQPASSTWDLVARSTIYYFSGSGPTGAEKNETFSNGVLTCRDSNVYFTSSTPQYTTSWVGYVLLQVLPVGYAVQG